MAAGEGDICMVYVNQAAQLRPQANGRIRTVHRQDFKYELIWFCFDSFTKREFQMATRELLLTDSPLYMARLLKSHPQLSTMTQPFIL